MYSIGQFSIITRLSVRTLRRYHESRLLVPDHVDEETGYRYYRDGAVERARVITALRELDYPIAEISRILESCNEDEDLLDSLIRRQKAITEEVRELQKKKKGLTFTIQRLKDLQCLPLEEDIQIKDIPGILFAGNRGLGRWEDIGTIFSGVGRKAGRLIQGPAMSLCYDDEYKEEDADYEAGFPVKGGTPSGNLDIRELPGIHCMSLIHRGPYAELGRSYERLIDYAREQDLSWGNPTREIYHRGPGIFFRGKPQNYITEIQIPIPF